MSIILSSFLLEENLFNVPSNDRRISLTDEAREGYDML